MQHLQNPEGTVEGLLKPESLDKLKAVLTHHVVAGKFDAATVIDAINKTESVTTVPFIPVKHGGYKQVLSIDVQNPNIKGWW
jgi:uncharacterized surface protein with fasciclin (FAS1) repeats